MPDTLRIALLLDADNLDEAAIRFATENAKGHGRLVIRRAWGRLNALRGHERVLADLGFAAEAALSAARGAKDTADLMLAQFAVRLAERRLVDIVALASSDSDFAAIARGVHESGLETLGYGRASSPLGLREAVTRFVPFPEKEPVATAAKPIAPEKPGQEQAKLVRVIEAALDKNGGARLSQLGSAVNKAFGGEYKKVFGVSSMTKLIEATPGFRLEGKGIEARVVRAKKA
ncbi:MAG: NYN domain-containing protein [Pseudomonadota bacterium]